MATPDKYEKDKPVATAPDHVSDFAPADSQLEDVSQAPVGEVLLHDLVAEMPSADSQVEDLDAMDFDTYALTDSLDDQAEDLSLKDALERRLVAEERQPDRWGVEVEVPLEADETTPVPFTGDIQLEISPEVSWAEHVREMERLAELEREAEMSEKQRVQEVMDESIEVKERMAAEGTVPELLAEEKGAEQVDTEAEQPKADEPMPELSVAEIPGEQPSDEERLEEAEMKVEPPHEEAVPVWEEQIVHPPEEPVVPEVERVISVEEVVTLPEEPVVPPEEPFVPPEEPFVPPEESVVPPEEPVVPPEEPVIPKEEPVAPPEEPVAAEEEVFAAEVLQSEEDRETPYPMPDNAKEEVEGLPKEEEPADLPDPDFNEQIGNVRRFLLSYVNSQDSLLITNSVIVLLPGREATVFNHSSCARCLVDAAVKFN